MQFGAAGLCHAKVVLCLIAAAPSLLQLQPGEVRALKRSDLLGDLLVGIGIVRQGPEPAIHLREPVSHFLIE